MATAQARLAKPRTLSEVRIKTTAAFSDGEVVQLPDGRAGVKLGANASIAGDNVCFATDGLYYIQKKTTIAFLPGQEIWWNKSANKATYALDGDFFIGKMSDLDTVSETATEVLVDLNVRSRYDINMFQDEWDHEATLGLGVTILGGAAKLEFDAVAEVAQAAIHSIRTLPIASKPIFEAEVAIYAIGDNAALDIDVGLASASHATDFEAIAEFVSVHLDGNALDIKAQSDDGTTDVAIADTTVDAVDDVYFFTQWDCRDRDNCKLYINGIRRLSGTTFKLTAATGPLMCIAHIEKTSDDTVADVRVKNMRAYGTAQN